MSAMSTQWPWRPRDSLVFAHLEKHYTDQYLIESSYRDFGMNVVLFVLRSYAYWELHSSTHVNLHLSHAIAMTLGDDESISYEMQDTHLSSSILVHSLKQFSYPAKRAVECFCLSVYGRNRQPNSLSI